MRICEECNEPINAGKAECQPCKHRKGRIEASRRRRQQWREWMANVKAELECEFCGENRPACLDFHHHGEKNFSIGEQIWKMSYTPENTKRVLNEISICTVLCANCHRIEHWNEGIEYAVNVSELRKSNEETSQ